MRGVFRPHPCARTFSEAAQVPRRKVTVRPQATPLDGKTPFTGPPNAAFPLLRLMNALFASPGHWSSTSMQRRSLNGMLRAVSRGSHRPTLSPPDEQRQLDVAFLQRRRTIVDAALRMGDETAAGERRQAMALVRVAEKPWPRVLPLFLRLHPFQRPAAPRSATEEGSTSHVPDNVAERLLPCSAAQLYREVMWAERFSALLNPSFQGSHRRSYAPSAYSSLLREERRVYELGASRNREVRAAIQWLTAGDFLELAGARERNSRLYEAPSAPPLLRKVLLDTHRDSAWLLPAIVHQGVTPQETRSVLRSLFRTKAFQRQV